MKVDKIDLGETGLFSPIFLDYIKQKKPLQPFYNLYPFKENVGKQVKLKKESYSSETRKVLTTVLNSQYEGFTISDTLSSNLQKLEQKNGKDTCLCRQFPHRFLEQETHRHCSGRGPGCGCGGHADRPAGLFHADF